MPSSRSPPPGPHSNGYSLIRKVLEVSGADPGQTLPGSEPASSLADLLMAPTRIYVKPVLALMRQTRVHAMAHITGGGLVENLPRVLPKGVKAVVDLASWQRPAVFNWLQTQGGIADSEMLRTFNCGIGLVLCLPAGAAAAACSALDAAGERTWRLGHIAAAEPGAEPRVELTGDRAK